MDNGKWRAFNIFSREREKTTFNSVATIYIIDKECRVGGVLQAPTKKVSFRSSGGIWSFDVAIEP